MEVGVGIEIEDRNVLFKINKAKTLRENIETICKQNSLMSSQSYGLKFSYSAYSQYTNNYVTEENFHEIQDGFTMKLVESLDTVIDRIFKNFLTERGRSFTDLFDLSTDPGFINVLGLYKEPYVSQTFLLMFGVIVRKGRDKDVLQWLTDKYLSGKELSACLITLLHLLKKQHVKELLPAIVQNIIRCIKNNSPPTPPQQLQHALAVLCQILYLRGHELNKQIIILDLFIDDLVPFIWSQEHYSLQINTMMLINAMVKCVRGEKRDQFVKQLNRNKIKQYIFNNIIKNDRIDDGMARELYVYQTNILSIYSDSLNSYVDISSLTSKEFDCSGDNSNRSSGFIDFEYVPDRSRSNSTSTILEEIENIRISFASVESEISGSTETPISIQDEHISYLSQECLLYYKKHHYKNFRQSCLEENAYKPGVLVTSERIIRILAQILHIGRKPTSSGRSYNPLVFNASKMPFLQELFSRTMWLLSKTRREMKAWTFDDYPKVLVVLEKQIKMVLEEKPMDYNSLTMKMMDITYDKVDKQWQKEKELEWKNTYEKNASVQILKQNFLTQNEQLIFERRIKTLQRGGIFPKLPEKRARQQNFFLRLSDNRRMVFWGDWDDTLSEFKSREPQRFDISDIKHFVIGKACPHVKDNSTKFPDRAFSIILDEREIINFVAKDIKTANLWIDGFCLLLDKATRSDDYKRELEVLLEMDCALHLLELQNIPIPDVAPPVPPLPGYIRSKPPIPPKSPNLVMRRTLVAFQKTEI